MRKTRIQKLNHCKYALFYAKPAESPVNNGNMHYLKESNEGVSR